MLVQTRVHANISQNDSDRDRFGHNACTVRPVGERRAEEELRAVGVAPRVSHGQRARPRVLEREVLIFKCASVDRFA